GRVLAVPDPLGARLPGGGVQRGTVVAVDGGPGAGATRIGFQLAAAATAAGEWAAAVGLDASLGGLAAGEAGVELDRFAVVRRVPPARWAAVGAALLEGISVVLAEVPADARVGDARRLLAPAGERGAGLVGLGAWPAQAAARGGAGGARRGGGGRWAARGGGAWARRRPGRRAPRAVRGRGRGGGGTGGGCPRRAWGAPPGRSLRCAHETPRGATRRWRSW